MTMLTTFKCPETSRIYEPGVKEMGARQMIRMGEESVTLPGETDEEREPRKKFMSPQGEALSRWILVIYWNGIAFSFRKHLPVLMPAIVCLD